MQNPTTASFLPGTRRCQLVDAGLEVGDELFGRNLAQRRGGLRRVGEFRRAALSGQQIDRQGRVADACEPARHRPDPVVEALVLVDDQDAAARIRRLCPRCLQFTLRSRPGDRRGGQRLRRSRRRRTGRRRLRWRSPGRWRWSSCSRRTRRSARWPPRCSPPAVPAGAGLRVWTTIRRHDQWQFLRRCSAVRVSRSRVCREKLNWRWQLSSRAILIPWMDAGCGCPARPRSACRRRHPRRGARYRGGARRSRRDGDLYRPQQRVRQRAVRLRPSGNHRRDSANLSRHSAASASRSRSTTSTSRRCRRSPIASGTTTAPSTSWSTTSGVPRCSRATRRRGTGRSGNTTSTTVCESCGSASTPTSSPSHCLLPLLVDAARRPARRSDRRDKGIQRPRLPDLGVLRPVEGRGEPARLQPRSRPRSASAPPPSPSRRAGCARR